jgi:hypothetical protein
MHRASDRQAVAALLRLTGLLLLVALCVVTLYVIWRIGAF